MNTAGHAAGLGRALGAVPGPVTSAASAGCHRLIRDFAATCVTNPDEMAELAPLPAPRSGLAGELPASGALLGSGEGGDGIGREGIGDSSNVTRVVDALSVRSPRTSEDIASRSGLSTAQVRAALGTLALDGRAAERDRGWVVVRR